MKEINGTVTLAYLEEDNKQRVIFRVIPLCTREGGAFHGDADSFPDEGSLRVVPDKREQSTFKERMRELGSLCAIYLISDGKELMKVRANRNYSPEQGERNQYAIYSDVICEFAEDGCFEVVDAGASAEAALTDKVLIYKDKLLYGPVDRASVATAALADLKPFGNDNFLLHTIESPIIGKRRVYWNPDATLNWRQRRNTARRRDRAIEPGARDMETAKEAPRLPADMAADDVAEPQKPEAVKRAELADDSAKPITAKLEEQQPEGAAPDFAKPEAQRFDAQKRPEADSASRAIIAHENVKPSSIKQESIKADTANPELEKPEVIKPEAKKLEAQRFDAQRLDAQKRTDADAARRATAASEIIKPFAVKQDAAKLETTKLEARSSELAKPEAQKRPYPEAQEVRSLGAGTANQTAGAPAEAKAATLKPGTDARAEQEPRQRQEQRSRRVERTSREQPKDGDASLPIGSRLDILDAQMPFDAQIDRLAQPLSESANRLTDIPAEIPEDDGDEVVARFTGTPLTPPAVRVKRGATRPDTVHRIVEQQLRGQRDEVMGAELGSGVYGMVENPIETLQNCVDYIWQNPDARSQAISALMDNEGFVNDMLYALRQGGMNPQAAAAAQEQLSEIEAERLSLLMQLEAAKANEAKFREEALKSLSQKKRDESERLKREVNELEKLKGKLSSQTQALSTQSAAQLTDYLAKNMTCLTGADEQRILLSPVLGSEYTQTELAEQLRRHMNDSGYSLSDDDATSLLINFSLYDTLCFRDTTIEDANNFARVLLESFGLQSVSAIIMPGAYVEMVSLLPENAMRTPTVTVQPLGTETMTVYGHKTIYLTDAANLPVEDELVCGYPVINAPKLQQSRAFGYAEEWRTIAPASLASFAAVRSDAQPLMSEAEKWFAMLTSELKINRLELPELAMQSMRRFIEVASRKVRGGFLAAADNAVTYWVAPLIIWRNVDAAGLAGALSGLPHTLEMLGIK